MEGRNGSGGHSSSGVVKNRSSSGCLIIKKKADGVSGVGSSKCFEKRPRLNATKRYEEFQKRGVPERNEVMCVYENMGYGREVGPKRSKADVYDFDEYDDLSDIEMLRMRRHYHDGMGGRERWFSGAMSGLEVESGSSKGDIIYKRRNSFHGGSRIDKIESADIYSGKRRFEMRNVEKFGGSEDAIRLQGKNGVLKVRVKHKDKEDISEQLTLNYNHVKPNSVAPSPSSQKLTSNSFKYLEKNQKRKCKSLSADSSKESDEDSDNVKVERSTKRGRSDGRKEGKVKRGSGTEKQLLREKIRTMLINAGWTIDYRPRRGRDYSDAVYVNPNGTAYWSIIKAYDALQKQLEEEGNGLRASENCSSFAPISEDVLSKLTRQTRKKIEKELKRKKREEAGGKRKKEFDEDESDTDSGSMKGASKESPRRDGKGERSSPMSSKKIGRCMLLVRNSGKGLYSETGGFIPYTGKRNLLSWLIDCGTVKLSEKVHYMNRRCTRVLLEGWITREGIHCGCCSKILTVSKFEIHAASKLRQPYQNIYLSSGPSLMQCQIDAWNRQEESLCNGYNKIDVNGDDPNDDTCAVCGDGGNLICCDNCPSTFHQSCLGVEMLPPGDWHCPHCSCRLCGLVNMTVIEGNDRRQDPVLTCCLCGGKYHCSCVEEMDGTVMNLSSPPFCGKTCQELSEHLQKLLGIKHELEAGLFWSFIHRTDLGSDSAIQGFPQRVEWNSKLAVALTVMDECFLPINDRKSGINMIQSVLYNSGSNITRLNYSGFYTAILEKGDEIVSAASIRIHGTEFAEMPFIGTRHVYRRQGMCHRLFSSIESALRSLKVEKLIIPAISELMDTWTTVFGFCTLKESDKRDMKIGNMLVFPGIDMLQKKLFVKDSVKKGSEGVSSYENRHNASVMPGLTMKSEFDSSFGPSSVAAEPENEEMKDKPVTDFGSEDMVCAYADSQLDASDCLGVPSLPTDNEGTLDKSFSVFASGDVICTDEISLHSAGDCFKEVACCLATEEMKNKSSDSGSEDMICTDCHEEVKTPLPTVYEEMKDESVSDFCFEQLIRADENSLPNAYVDCCEKLKLLLPTASPHDCNDNKSTESEKIKCKPVSSVFEQTFCADENSLPNVSADWCEEVKPCFPTAPLHDCNVNKSFESEEMKGNSISSAPADCLEEVTPSLVTALPCDSDDNRPSSQAVFDEAKLLFSNGGCMVFTSSELQFDAKFNESGADVRDHISEDASTGAHETGNVLDSYDAKYKMDVSFDSKMMQRDNVAVAESGSPPNGDSVVAASSNGVLNCLQKGGIETQSIEILSSKSESKHDPLPDPSHVDIELETPMVVSPAEDNFRHCPGVKVDEDSYILPAETEGRSGSQPLHVSDNINIDSAHKSKMDISRNDMVCSPVIGAIPVDDMTCKSPQIPSDSIISVEKPQQEPPTFKGEVN